MKRCLFTGGQGDRLRRVMPSLVLWACAMALRTSATPANPELRMVVQPDGRSFAIRLCGDEFYSWHETSDGYSIVQDATDGYWKYAQPVSGQAELKPIPKARVGASDPAEYRLSLHVRPAPEDLRKRVRQRQQELEGMPEELPEPGFTKDAESNQETQ